MSDYVCVGCQGYREALSARLDGEPAQLSPAEVDAHLRACPECRRWSDDAAAVTRLARTGPAADPVDVTGAVLPAVPSRWRGRFVTVLRLLLGSVGVAQVVLGLLQATTLRPAGEGHGGTMVDGASAGHLWHESVAWNVAVGAAFLWVASRRHGPAGLVPIMTVFVVALGALSVTDAVTGRVEATRLASHSFVLAGYVLVLALSRRTAGPRPGGEQAAAPAPTPAPGGGTRDDAPVLAHRRSAA